MKHEVDDGVDHDGHDDDDNNDNNDDNNDDEQTSVREVTHEEELASNSDNTFDIENECDPPNVLEGDGVDNDSIHDNEESESNPPLVRTSQLVKMKGAGGMIMTTRKRPIQNL